MRSRSSRSTVRIIAACAVLFLFALTVIGLILLFPAKNQDKEEQTPPYPTIILQRKQI